MVGETGRVVAVDVQERMLSTLAKRANRKGVERVIETRLASQEDLRFENLSGAVDLVLAIHVVHETTYPRRFLEQCRDVLCPGGSLLLIEPKGHVSEEDFEATRQMSLEAGFSQRESIGLRRSRGLVFINTRNRP